MAILPTKILNVVFSLGNATANVPSGYWVGSPYQWEATLSVIPQPHGSNETPTPFFYDGNDVKVGDHIVTSGQGRIVKIVSISSQESIAVACVVEDWNFENIYQDSSQSGSGAIPDGEGYLFSVLDGAPIIHPLPDALAGVIPAYFASSIVSRFQSQQTQSEVEVEQGAHGFSVGTPIYLMASGLFAQANSGSEESSRIIGIVTNVDYGPDKFRFRPFGQQVSNIAMPAGAPGSVVYLSNTGELTTVPSVGSVPVFIKTGNNSAVAFQAGGGMRYSSSSSSSSSLSSSSSSSSAGSNFGTVEASTLDFDGNYVLQGLYYIDDASLVTSGGSSYLFVNEADTFGAYGARYIVVSPNNGGWMMMHDDGNGGVEWSAGNHYLWGWAGSMYPPNMYWVDDIGSPSGVVTRDFFGTPFSSSSSSSFSSSSSSSSYLVQPKDVTGVALTLLNFEEPNESTSFIDDTGNHIYSAVGGAKISSAYTIWDSLGSGLFNGVSDKVTAPNHANFEIFTHSLVTLAGWFRINDISNYGTICSCMDGTGANGWYLYHTGAGFFVKTKSGNVIRDGFGASGKLLQDFWHHFVLLKQGSAARLWLDGDYVAQDTSVSSVTSGGSPFQIGYNDDLPTYWFDGYIDSLVITNNNLHNLPISGTVSSPAYNVPVGPYVVS